MWWNSDKYRIWGYPSLCNPPVAKTPLGGRGPPSTRILFSAFHKNLKSIPISFDVDIISMIAFNDCKITKKTTENKKINSFFSKKMNFISCGRGSPSFFEVSLLAVVARYDNPFDYWAFLAFSTIALKASGLFIARSARTLRLISIPALWIKPINLE